MASLAQFSWTKKDRQRTVVADPISVVGVKNTGIVAVELNCISEASANDASCTVIVPSQEKLA